MAGITNWTTDTSIDAATGKVLVTITVVDVGGQRYQQEWLSDAPAPLASAASPAISASSPRVRLNQPAVSTESFIAGPALAATVAARTLAPSKVRISVPRRG